MKNESLNILEEKYKQNSSKILQDFFTFLSFQSISSEQKYKPEIERCAEWLKKYVEEIGFTCELWPTSHHPVLFAQWNDAGPEKPTLLIYNHYDVQPVDPLEEWDSPPFEPTIRHGNIYARGAQDNKGQCFYVLQALKLLMNKDRKLPLNIKLCIEGEEECGSHGLSEILKIHKQKLKADYLAIVDLDIPAFDQPAVTLGLRGMTTMDVEFTGSHTDMHSGSHGGVVFNPIHALVEVLSKLRDSSGKILVPGFYDEVKNLSAEELKHIDTNFNTEQYEKDFGAQATGGEIAYSPYERNWLRPTLEINGISGGYSGTGFKTVIPAKAYAKISCRLVPNQVPHVIAKRVAQYIQQNAPSGINAEVRIHEGGGIAVNSKVSSKVVQAFSKAYEEVYQTSCKYFYSGASIPIVPELSQTSESEVVLLGVGLKTDNIHAPNEHFGLDRLEKGCLMICRGIELLSKGV